MGPALLPTSYPGSPNQEKLTKLYLTTLSFTAGFSAAVVTVYREIWQVEPLLRIVLTLADYR